MALTRNDIEERYQLKRSHNSATLMPLPSDVISYHNLLDGSSRLPHALIHNYTAWANAGEPTAGLQSSLDSQPHKDEALFRTTTNENFDWTPQHSSTGTVTVPCPGIPYDSNSGGALRPFKLHLRPDRQT